MDLTGKIIVIGDEKQISDRFKKRTFVIEAAENPEYPEQIEFELKQDRTGLIDGYSVGQTVKVFFNITGRKWESPQGDRYFIGLNAWRLSKVDQAASPIPDEPPPAEDFRDQIPF